MSGDGVTGVGRRRQLWDFWRSRRRRSWSSETAGRRRGDDQFCGISEWLRMHSEVPAGGFVGFVGAVKADYADAGLMGNLDAEPVADELDVWDSWPADEFHDAFTGALLDTTGVREA